jgi:hypothetical protein
LSLDDLHEDGPPLLEPPSVPPIPIEQLRPPNTSERDTLPIADAAQQVIDILAPKLDEILTKLSAIEKRVGHLDDEVIDLRANRITTVALLGALDRGVSATLNAVTTLDATVYHLKNAQTDTTNAVLRHTEELKRVRVESADLHDHAMARIVAIEDWKKEHTGEDDGSIVAALAREGGG